MALVLADAVDQVALQAFGRLYTNLSDEQKTILTGSTSASNTGGVINMTLLAISQYALALGYASTDSANSPPASWLNWWVFESAWNAVRSMKPEQEPVFRAGRLAVMRTALESLPGGDTGNASAGGSSTLSVNTLRQSIVTTAIRQKPPLLPSVNVMDEAIRWAFDYLWNRAFWLFERRHINVTMTITDPYTPTFTSGLQAGEAFKANATRHWYYTDLLSGVNDSVYGAPSQYVQWVDGDVFNAVVASAIQSGQQLTGRPQFVRIQPGNDLASSTPGQIAWEWFPIPDQAYTLRGECYVAAPTFPTSSTDSAAFSKFPINFRTCLRDLSTAKTLRAHNVPGSDKLLMRAMGNVTELLPKYQDVGAFSTDVAARDVYQDPAAANMPYGIGQGGL